MRNLHVGLAVLTALCLLPGWSSAQDQGLFERLDANKDGFVTPDEAGGEDRKRLFERLLRTADKDKDGKLSREEFAAGVKVPPIEPRPEDRPDARPDRRPEGRPEPRQVFNRFDKNGDGKLSKDEAPDGLKDNFDRIDANKDGSIDPEELIRDLGRNDAGNVQRFLEQFDKNKDGKISKDEAPDRFKTNFDRVDANKDGSLDKDEIARAMGGVPEFRQPDANFYTELFKRQDANKDGKLTADEVPEDRREQFVDMLKRLGKTESGVTLEEFVKGVAQAGPPLRPQPGAPPPGGPFGIPGGPLMRALDTDRDGQLSADEIAAATKALAALDKNGDGKLTRDELAPPPPPGGAGGIGNPQALLERLKDADKNGDGKLSKEELPDFLQGSFERLDANKDGSLDKEELQAVLPRLDRRPENRRPEQEK